MTHVLLWIGVVLAGGVGSLLRFVVDEALRSRGGRELPLGILGVNVSGALALGVVAGLALDDDAYLVLGIALVGSYTTFSSWMLDTVVAGSQRRWAVAVANIGVSLVLGLAAAALGRAFGAAL